MIRFSFLAVATAMLIAAPAIASPHAPSRSTFGVVAAADGTKLRGNASFVQKNQDLEGTYHVFFNYDVSNCVYVASVTGTGSTPVESPAIITVANAFNTPTAVAVQIRSPSGTLVPRGFHLLVRCF